MKIKSVKELQDYISSGNCSTKVLLNNLTTTIYIENTMCHMKIWKGNKGWTICYNSNDKSIGTPNISTKSHDIDDVCIKAIEYLLQYNFHDLQNKDRNIFLDMLTIKN